MIAALYVQRGGVYYGLPDVDPWDEERDARKYAGPWPVVAHPPCSRWCKPLAMVNETRYGHKVGDDGGCFAMALAAVIAFGGVLEHPAHSAAWDYFGLDNPVRGKWSKSFKNIWTCEVSQAAYGHRAQKLTWLLYSGIEPGALNWDKPKPSALTSWLPNTRSKLPRLSKKEASATPEPFRDMLISLAVLASSSRPRTTSPQKLGPPPS